MDAYEATKVVFARVQALVDPDLASRIMGALLTQDRSEEDMIRLAFGTEQLLLSVVSRARADLACSSKPSSSPPAPAPSCWGMVMPGAAAGGGGGEEAPFAAGYDGGGEALFYPEEEYGCWSPASGGSHRRSFSPSDAEAFWKPCLYYARGFCKNGSACRFLHGLPDDGAAAAAEQEMAVMRAAAVRSQTMASSLPFSPSPPKGLNFLLQQQQSESQRAAAMLLGGGEDMHRLSFRSPRMDRGDLTVNHGSRQIYLTFPADSTFSEEDVSNYFSMYGPVQDVRIPHQPKRMFGFVSFVYPETVRLILAKGNPHFICDARVLVKPYKEKGKVPDKFRHAGHFIPPPPHHREFAAGCAMPLDARDPFDLQQPQIGQRMLYGSGMAGHEAAFLRRKLEEQQEAAELQQAIELQGRRFLGLQLLDLNSRAQSHHHHHHLSSPPVVLGQADGNGSFNVNGNGVQDNALNTTGLAMSTASAAISAIAAQGKQAEQQEEEEGDGNGSPKRAVNSGEDGEGESGPGAAAAPNVVCGFQERTKCAFKSYCKKSGTEHNLPDSPFASPTKASIDAAAAATAHTGNISNSSSPHLVASSLFPSASPYSSCFFQVPRFSPGHGAIGL